MEFDLSEELLNEIIFSMEDQTGKYVLDSAVPQITAKTDDTVNPERWYELPHWDSLAGFKIRERFVSLLRNPLLRVKLCDALFSGKGVFKQFKSVLKENPEAEKLWRSFKQREMRSVVYVWYNALREIWGLEKLGQEPEETADLVYEDFTFRGYDADRDEEALVLAVNEVMHEFEEAYEGETGQALAALWQNQRQIAKPETELTFISETGYGDFAGGITVCPYPESAKETVLLTAWLVRPQFRGFGIGKELLMLCLRVLRENGIRWVILANLAVPHYISSVLARSGFNRAGSGFILDLENIGNPDAPDTDNISSHFN